jgi:hypothetical protein
VRSLPAISIGIGGGSRFASVAACSLRSQSKSSGVRFGFVCSHPFPTYSGSPSNMLTGHVQIREFLADIRAMTPTTVLVLGVT